MTKTEYFWAKFKVSFSWLAELDQGPAPNVLADALGDTYLYRHNPVYAGIRDAAVRFGYSFSSEDTPLWRDYQCFSLTTLPRILSGRTIPYLDTAATFRRLVEANPGTTLRLGLIAANLQRNHAFHESAHCVAHSIMERRQDELRAVAPGATERAVLEAILAESFANSVEALGSIFEHMPIPDNLFYRLNSYIFLDQKGNEVLSRAGAVLGEELRFTLLLLSYFEANLATGAPTDATYDRIAEAAGCTTRQAELAREIAGISFRLSAGFRENTTPAYFELLGHSREYDHLVRAGWLGHVQNRSLIRSLGQSFWKAAGRHALVDERIGGQ